MNVEVIIGVGQSEMAYQSIKDPKEYESMTCPLMTRFC